MDGWRQSGYFSGFWEGSATALRKSSSCLVTSSVPYPFQSIARESAPVSEHICIHIRTTADPYNLRSMSSQSLNGPYLLRKDWTSRLRQRRTSIPTSSPITIEQEFLRSSCFRPAPKEKVKALRGQPVKKSQCFLAKSI